MTVPGWGWGWERDLEESIFKPQADAWGYRCGYEWLGECCGDWQRNDGRELL